MSEHDWSHWINRADVELFDAIKLSLNVCPDGADTDKISPMSEGATWTDAESARIRLDIACRQTIAMSHVDAGTLSIRLVMPEINFFGGGKKSARRYVSLIAFRAWGESLPNPLSFPDEFPRPAPATVVPTDAPQVVNAMPCKPVRADAHENYLRIIRALLEMTTAPDHGTTTAILNKLRALGFDVDPSKPDVIETKLKAARDLIPENSKAARK